jgi:hypothetical protein
VGKLLEGRVIITGNYDDYFRPIGWVGNNASDVWRRYQTLFAGKENTLCLAEWACMGVKHRYDAVVREKSSDCVEAVS